MKPLGVRSDASEKNPRRGGPGPVGGSGGDMTRPGAKRANGAAGTHAAPGYPAGSAGRRGKYQARGGCHTAAATRVGAATTKGAWQGPAAHRTGRGKASGAAPTKPTTAPAQQRH